MSAQFCYDPLEHLVRGTAAQLYPLMGFLVHHSAQVCVGVEQQGDLTTASYAANNSAFLLLVLAVGSVICQNGSFQSYLNTKSNNWIIILQDP